MGFKPRFFARLSLDLCIGSRPQEVASLTRLPDNDRRCQSLRQILGNYQTIHQVCQNEAQLVFLVSKDQCYYLLAVAES